MAPERKPLTRQEIIGLGVFGVIALAWGGAVLWLLVAVARWIWFHT